MVELVDKDINSCCSYIIYIQEARREMVDIKQRDVTQNDSVYQMKWNSEFQVNNGFFF